MPKTVSELLAFYLANDTNRVSRLTNMQRGTGTTIEPAELYALQLVLQAQLMDEWLERQ